ncbi:MAG: 3-phosphoshikimate 1-carboxyvinyltransferase [Chloroflexi bacterium]|nr:3-phosphoshikimate 1-carboxyvinyltransferase [Chloroflexota bacterium]
MSVTIRKPKSLRGEIIVPGDKSISHRAVIFNSMAKPNKVSVRNFLPGEDCYSTIKIMRQLGVDIDIENDKSNSPIIIVNSVGLHGFKEPTNILNCGNSGTTTRLISGALAGRDFISVLSGDKSLNSRPMGRIIKPLSEMGAKIFARKNNNYAPIIFSGGLLKAISYKMPVASAQIKSCIILAALRASGSTKIFQKAISRDHSERMLIAMGSIIKEDKLDIHIEPSELDSIDVDVPGDISSAAFWMIAALCHPDSEILIKKVGINKTRSGIITVLESMNAEIKIINQRDIAGEPIGDIYVKTSNLRATEISGDIIPLLIDEIPIIALAASFADGITHIKNAEELRVKESDRISTTVNFLKSCGVEIEATNDGMIITGNPDNSLRYGSFSSNMDHRITMMMAIAGVLSTEGIKIIDDETASVSYPNFWETISNLGVKIE